MKTDPRVDAYIKNAAPFARPILTHLRRLVRRAEPAVEEAIKWSTPMYLSGGRILCATAAFKAHCAFIFWHQAVRKQVQQDGPVKGADARGQFRRITQRTDLPSDAVLLRYLKLAVKLNQTNGPARERRPAKRKPPLSVPADLTAGLRREPKAAATFAAFSPSCRREYVEWIGEAKRPETRAKRVATTLEWLATGKKRNWKYEGC